ncbi:hypothetical protein GCM10028793_15280 [Nocardiopsis oceani]
MGTVLRLVRAPPCGGTGEPRPGRSDGMARGSVSETAFEGAAVEVDGSTDTESAVIVVEELLTLFIHVVTICAVHVGDASRVAVSPERGDASPPWAVVQIATYVRKSDEPMMSTG